MDNKIGLAVNPDPPVYDYKIPCCPLCGEECETIFFDRFGDLVGCDNCITTKDAWDVDECYR